MSPPAEPLLSPTRGLWIGVGFVCAANVLLPLQDALSKDFVQALPVWQVLLARSLAVLALALLLGGRPLVRRLPRARRLPTMVVRALVNLAAWGAFYLALRDIPLAQLSLEEMQGVEPGIDERVFSVLSARASMESRTSFGGTSPVRVREQVAAWKARLG